MSNQTKSLEDRLSKRRQLRDKRYLNTSSVDNSEITLINNSQTTRSLDRKSSERTIPMSPVTSPVTSAISTNQPKSSATTVKNPELPPIENASSKQNHLSSNNKTNSTPPPLPQVTKHQPVEPENDKQVSPKARSTNEQQKNDSYKDEKPLVVKETVLPPTTEKSNPIHENSHSHQNEKPVVVKETVLPPTTTEKSNPIHENSHSHQNEKPVAIKETVFSPTTTEKSNPIHENSHSDQNEKPVVEKSHAIHENSHSDQDEKPVVVKETVLPPTTTEKSNPIHENSHSHQNEKPVIIKETALPLTTTEKSNPIHENSHSQQNEKPMIVKETITPILPSIITKKPNPIPLETRGNSTPNQIKSFSLNSDMDHPSSYPQSTIDRQQKQFSYPPFYPKPIPRTTSEQSVSKTKYKHQPIDSIFTKQNSLALSYLFNKRMIESELARASSLDSEPSQVKTVWD